VVQRRVRNRELPTRRRRGALALEETAKEFGAAVKEIERPFSLLLKEDRLDLSY
jgi:hypothetical protein